MNLNKQIKDENENNVRDKSVDIEEEDVKVLDTELSIDQDLDSLENTTSSSQLDIFIKKWKVKDVINDTFYYININFYLFIPISLYKLFQFFDCITLENGSSYIRMETNINCNSKLYQQLSILVIIFTIIYLSIPILWFIGLYRKRHLFHSMNTNIKGKERDEKHLMYLCDNNPHLFKFKYIFNDYKSDSWYFEIIDMFRRILFISIIPLLSKQYRSTFSCLITFLFIYVFRERQPFREEFSNSLAYLSQFSILLTFHAALSIETSTEWNYFFKNQSLGLWLIFINLLPFILTIWWAIISTKKEYQYQVNRLLKVKKNDIFDN